MTNSPDQAKTRIVLPDGKHVAIPKKIIQKEIFKNVLLILSDPLENNEINDENVFGYDLYGNELWQIEDLKLFHKRHDYTSIYIENAEVYLYNRCGVEVKINPETGKVLSKALTK
jgi:hypothetical protein